MGATDRSQSALGGRVKRFLIWLLVVVALFCAYLTIPQESLARQGAALLLGITTFDPLARTIGMAVDGLIALAALTAPLWLAGLIFKRKKAD